MFINLELKQSATIVISQESVSEVVAYRISEDIHCLAPPGGENFRQPPDSLTPCLTFNLTPPTKETFSGGSGQFHSRLQLV